MTIDELKKKMLKKTSLKTQTVEIDGCELVVQELSGPERVMLTEQAQNNDGGMEARYKMYIAFGCPSLSLTEDEFHQLFEMNYSFIEDIVGAIFEVSGMTKRAKEQTEKN